VYYARDAMAGLAIMNRLVSGPKTAMTPAKSATRQASADMHAKPRPNERCAVLRTKVQHAAVEGILPLLDCDALFLRRWRMLKQHADAKKQRAARAELDRMLKWAASHRLWHCRFVQAVFIGLAENDDFTVLLPGRNQELCRFSFAPRFQARLARRHAGEPFHAALQIVTLGRRVVAEARRMADAGMVHDGFLLHGIAAELTEALAGFAQSQVPRFPGWEKTARYSPGYPVWPDLAEQRKIFALLRPERIGLSLSETNQIVPEYSTSAIILPE
jgi:5-methyltetrahydrofolate--homocysteine methyltransferase